MGGLVGGIFDLAEGDPTAHETQQLGGLGNYETGVGEGLTTAGSGFEEGILSGDPSRIGQALAPEISAGQGQVEQQALQNANFGNRSGGTNASTQAAEGADRGNIINLIGGLQSGTAGAAVGQGSNLLGQASSNLSTEAQLAAANQQRVTGDVSGIAQSAAAIADPFLGGGGSGAPPTLDTTGGADPLNVNTPELPNDLISQYQPSDLGSTESYYGI
jgi:hypothetical protein